MPWGFSAAAKAFFYSFLGKKTYPETMVFTIKIWDIWGFHVNFPKKTNPMFVG